MKCASNKGKYSFEIILTSLLLGFIAFLVLLPPAGQAEIERADVLNQKVLSLYQAGKYNEAVPIAYRVLDLREKTQGPTHWQVAEALQILSALYEAVGEHEKAVSLDKRALQILEPESQTERNASSFN